MRATIVVVLLAQLSTPAVAGSETELPGLLRQSLWLPVTTPSGVPSKLEALVIRSDGPGPFPLALIAHGLPRTGADIANTRPQTYSSPAIAFAQRGYAAVIVMRRGYGHSGGRFAETPGPCEDRDYVKAGQEAGADLLGALERLRSEPWVDPARILLVGHSMGGFAALAAAASDPAGVMGTLSFSGAVGSPKPDTVCQTDRLIEADRVFGQTTHIPSLWVFAGNDHYFGPELALRMFHAYVAAGAPASFFMAPPFGRDGHLLILAPADTTWWAHVAPFLRSLRLPTKIQVPLPPPAPIAEPVALDETGRAAFASYVPSRSYEKAFAIDAAGHFGMALGQRTKMDAEQAAMTHCQLMAGTCSVYAVGNEVVATDRATAR